LQGSLGRRWHALKAEIDDLDAGLAPLVTAACPDGQREGWTQQPARSARTDDHAGPCGSVRKL
jgi:hypothetical protein